jgi:hypothetical protein
MSNNVPLIKRRRSFSITRNWRLGLVLLIYLALAGVYSVVAPIGAGADEWAHYWYASFIAAKGRLPASFAEREVAGYKSDWPPLYHGVVAGITAWVETDGPPTFKYRADSIRRQLIPALGPEAILHTEDELFPWRQEIWVWHMGRFLSIIFSGGTLLITYFVALEVFGEWRGEQRMPRRTLALVTTVSLAFVPRFLFTGMLFSYDSLTLLLASCFLWVCLRVVRGHISPEYFWALGVLAGLAFVTKYLAALLPLEIILIALLRQKGRQLTFSLLRSFTAFILTTGWWFGYLIVNFNEVERYGPILGTLAPLIQGDGSDRTLTEIFAFFGGENASLPTHLEKQSYTPWQIVAEFPTTLFGNPIARPYPLDWFVGVMTVVAIVAMVGVWRSWRAMPRQRPILTLLLSHCALPLPFMLIRLYGARDALEAVQGRHLLFLAGPAATLLLVWGLAFHLSRFSHFRLGAPHLLFVTLTGLLLTGALSQLIFMAATYPPLLPVRTTPYTPPQTISPAITLDNGAKLLGYEITPLAEQGLSVTLWWQAGEHPTTEDYLMELALVDTHDQHVSGWLAYQTEAHYPTRAWESGDIIRDEGRVPFGSLAAGSYTLKFRLLGAKQEIIPWQTLSTYTPTHTPFPSQVWELWPSYRSLFHERETVQFRFNKSSSTSLLLLGPDKILRLPAATWPTTTNFIIDPSWPAGGYRIQADDNKPEVLPTLHVAANHRNFQAPAPMYPLNAHFAGGVTLLGYELPTRQATAGNGLPLTLYWQGREWIGEDLIIFTRLLDHQQISWGGYDRRPQENYSTLLWAPGEFITDGFAVPIEPDTPNGIYTIAVGLYRGEAESLPLLDLTTGQSTTVTALTLGPVKIGGPPASLTLNKATPQIELNVILGNQIKLLGFDHEKVQDKVHLTLYWQCLSPPETDYTTFLHLQNAAGKIVAQQDNPPVGGTYPTSLWSPGEIIPDKILLDVPPDLDPTATYHLLVGLYDLKTGKRLSVPGFIDNAITLTEIDWDRPTAPN